jgi:hypothetical protein
MLLLEADRALRNYTGNDVGEYDKLKEQFVAAEARHRETLARHLRDEYGGKANIPYYRFDLLCDENVVFVYVVDKETIEVALLEYALQDVGLTVVGKHNDERPLTPGSMYFSFSKSSVGAHRFSNVPFATLLDSRRLSSLIDLRRLLDDGFNLTPEDLDGAPPRKIKIKCPSSSSSSPPSYKTWELLPGKERWTEEETSIPLNYEWRKYMSDTRPVGNWLDVAGNLSSLLTRLEPNKDLRSRLAPQQMYQIVMEAKSKSDKALREIYRLNKVVVKTQAVLEETAKWKGDKFTPRTAATAKYFLELFPRFCKGGGKEGGKEGGREGGREGGK